MQLEANDKCEMPDTVGGGEVGREEEVTPSIVKREGEHVSETVFVTHVESSNKVWVVGQVKQAELDLVMEEMAELRHSLEPFTDVKTREPSAAIFSEDGELYRGKDNG